MDPVVAQRGWVTLTRNYRQRYTPAERDLVMRHGGRIIVLAGREARDDELSYFAKFHRSGDVHLWLDRETWQRRLQ